MAAQRIDVLIGLALVVAVAGSVLGVVTYEDERLATFEVSWSTTRVSSSSERATNTGPGEATVTFDVEVDNLTRGEVVVTVTGSVPRVQPTALLVEILPPGLDEGFQQEAELPAGAQEGLDIVVPIELASVPDVESVRAPSFAAARAQLNATHASALGVGTWTVRVTFAPSAPGPLSEEAHTVRARATLERYEADVTLDLPEVRR